MVTRVLKKRIRNGVIGVAGLAPLVFKPRVFLLSYTKGPELQKKKKRRGKEYLLCPALISNRVRDENKRDL